MFKHFSLCSFKRKRKLSLTQKLSDQGETVYYAATYKHVPLVEMKTLEGLRNNVLGTESLIEACQFHLPKSFVLVSTDKAVRPTNLMGSSKRMARVTCSRCFVGGQNSWTMVRFGNILDSSGPCDPALSGTIEIRGSP